ncbi:MAG: SMP-30/gluconolactonase/LRE family protein [Deltaproteobacteria bacterium]|nr:SMP-30/gluconolactonase/LRE family protein [Deltaproteobacteria bacterium]
MKKLLWFSVVPILFVFVLSGCSSLKEGECKKDIDCKGKIKGVAACYKEPPDAEIGKCMTVKKAKIARAKYERKKSGKCEDKDGDGVKAGDGCDPPIDCDDSDPMVKPDASEVCDSKDNNCNDEINEGLKGCVGTVMGGKQDPIVKFMSTMTAGVEAVPNGDIYIADEHRIYRMDASTRKIKRIAGSNKPGNDDRKGTLARLDKPRGMVMDSNGNLYITECKNNCIRKLAPDGQVSRYAGLCSGEADHTGLDQDGSWEAARFWCPIDIDFDKDGNLLVADMLNSKIKRIGKGDRKVETIAGKGGHEDEEGYVVFGSSNGPALKAEFNEPAGIAVAKDGSIYIADAKNNCIRLLKDGKVSTFAGVCAGGKDKAGFKDGKASQARFKMPNSVAVALDGTVWVADTGNHSIRKIVDGVVSTVSGKKGQQGYYDGPVDDALFNGPQTITIAKDGSLYIVDNGNYRVRHLIP